MLSINGNTNKFKKKLNNDTNLSVVWEFLYIK